MKAVLDIIAHIIVSNKDILIRICIRILFYTLTLLATTRLFSSADEERQDTVATTPVYEPTDNFTPEQK